MTAGLARAESYQLVKEPLERDIGICVLPQVLNRLQTAPSFHALAACQLRLESYVGQLRALLANQGVIERALAVSTDKRVVAVWHPDIRKLPLLLQDLGYFETRTVADLKEPVDAALKTADALRLRAGRASIVCSEPT